MLDAKYVIYGHYLKQCSFKLMKKLLEKTIHWQRLYFLQRNMLIASKNCKKLCIPVTEQVTTIQQS